MTGSEAIEYIHSRLTFGSVLGLDRIKELCRMLGNPQEKLRFIHVAGTNGKGSISTMISETLIDAGCQTGLFTSPFVVDFRERIQLNGELITMEDLGEITARVKEQANILDSKGMNPTEFEILTATAFLYFYEKKCDAVVLEVGLGGLYDSTNIIKNTDVCVITSISFDHVAILGNTIKEIATNKAGIIKENSAVAVYPQLFGDADDVITETAKAKNCKLYKADKSKIDILKNDFLGTEFIYKGKKIKTQLIGEHQVYNAATAFEACTALIERGFNITESNIINGIYNATVPARVQIISKEPMIMVDGGHNADGVEALCKILKSSFSDYKITAIMGMMKDKDVDSAVAMTAPLYDKIITVTVNNPRSISASELKEKAEKYCKNVVACENPREAYLNEKSKIGQGEMLLVSGSLYLASEILGEG